MASEQFRIQLDEDFVRELERLADEYGKRSASAVAVEILQLYLPFWKDLRRREKEHYDQQRQGLKTGLSRSADS